MGIGAVSENIPLAKGPIRTLSEAKLVENTKSNR